MRRLGSQTSSHIRSSRLSTGRCSTANRSFRRTSPTWIRSTICSTLTRSSPPRQFSSLLTTCTWLNVFFEWIFYSSTQIYLYRNSHLSTLYSTVKSRTEMTVNTTTRQCTGGYLQCKQGTMLHIAVKTVKSNTVSTGQKGSKSTYNCPKWYVNAHAYMLQEFCTDSEIKHCMFTSQVLKLMITG